MKKNSGCSQCERLTVAGTLPTKNITIRIPIDLWVELRDAVTAGKIQSISAAALQGMRDAVRE
jgi:hypothetical protein